LSADAASAPRARPWGVATRCVQGEREATRARSVSSGDDAPIEAAQARLAALEGAVHASLHADARAAARALLEQSELAQRPSSLALSPRVGEPWRGALRAAAREAAWRVSAYDERAASSPELAHGDWLVCAALGEARLELCDVPRLAQHTRAAGARLALCADPAGPLVQTPLALGAHASLHAPLAGLAGDARLGGAAIAWDTARQPARRTRSKPSARLGAQQRELAHALLAGLPTLALRAAAQAASASVLAQFLAAHPRVAAVHHPSLERHPDRELAARVLRAHSARVAFELEPGLAASALLKRIALFERASGASARGGPRSAIRARTRTRASGGAPAQAALELWIGLEDDLDLIDALMAALESLG